MSGARVVVTGSEGFVGRHLRAAFAARGVEVVGVGRPGSGAEVEIDLAARDLDVRATVEQIGPVTGVVYLAAMIVRTSSVDAVARDNLEVIATRAAEWMEATHRVSPGAHFVYCSTLKAYGPPKVQPIDPQLPPQEPDPWSYGSAKAFAERILDTGAARSGASHCAVRLTYVFGPGQHPQNGIPAFLRACWSGKAPVIFGRGAEVRDDVYAPDVAYILAEACMRRVRGALHAGSGRALTLLETAEACCRAVEKLGGPAGLSPVLDASKPPKWWLDRSFDVARTRELLDYVPTPLDEALRREAEWVRDGALPEAAIAAAPPIVSRATRSAS